MWDTPLKLFPVFITKLAFARGHVDQPSHLGLRNERAKNKPKVFIYLFIFYQSVSQKKK